MSKSRDAGRRPFLLPEGVRFDERNAMDGVDLYSAIPDGKAAEVWLDPQYRAVMDAMSYGNEGARQKRRAALPQMSDDLIAYFVEEAQRVLRPSGHLLLWMDKFSLAEGVHLRWARRAKLLHRVDVQFWFTLRFGMGRRSRGSVEPLVVFQKEPKRAKDLWTDNGMRDGFPEYSDRTVHPHAKPVARIMETIRATTNLGDLVVDPCAGGYSVLEACRFSGRRFLGCDLVE